MSRANTLLERVEFAHGRPIPDAATGETIGHAPTHSPVDLAAMVAKARAVQPVWAGLADEERARTLRSAADSIARHADELAELVSREQGKALNGLGARMEASACEGWTRATADLEVPVEVLVDTPDSYAELRYRPLGVVGAIGPWNWPMMIAVWQLAPALRMGNAVIVKPSEHTPLSVSALVAAMNEALPADVLQVISGGQDVGAAMSGHPGLNKLMFTGSTKTGRAIVRASAANLARLTLELGGNDAGIVLPGADLARHAEGLFWGAFINTGQTCAALKRLYVHESQYEEAVSRLAELARTTPMGVGLDERNLLGPLQNPMQFQIVCRLVDDARARGARIVAGGAPAPELGANFYQATIVADVADGVPLVDEEQFGPALPVISYSDVEDAIASANRLDAGLGASVWSDDPQAAKEVALRLEAGTVWINQHGAISPAIPFGGVKGSGYGLEFGVEGLKSVARPMVVSGR